MMGLRKDDPLYYREELKKLLKNAKENGVNTYIRWDEVVFDDEENGNMTTRCMVKIDLMR